MGFIAIPTPGAVPAAIISPGNNFMNCETYATICGTVKIIVFVFPA
jgi:hypothetical protein